MLVVISSDSQRSSSDALLVQFRKIHSVCMKKDDGDYCFSPVPFRRLQKAPRLPLDRSIERMVGERVAILSPLGRRPSLSPGELENTDDVRVEAAFPSN